MRPTLTAGLALAVLLLAAGCSRNKGKIEGTNWVSQAAAVKGKELPAAARSLYFAKDGQMFFTDSGKPYKGTYTLGMGPAVTFTLEEEWQGRKIHPEKIVIDGKQLTMTGANGSVLTFRQTP